MDILADVARQFWHYIVEVFPYLALGFLFSGLIQVFVPSELIARHLGGRGARPLLYATVAGVVLPICCVGSLPVAVSLHHKGARIGPVLSFLVATPATSVPALLVSYGLLGLTFTVYIFVAVIVLGLAMGIIGNRLRFRPTGSTEGPAISTDPVCGRQVDMSGPDLITAEHEGATVYFCCDLCRTRFSRVQAEQPAACTSGQCARQPVARNRLLLALRHAFVTMPRDIGPEILVGLALAAVVAATTPIGHFIGQYFAGTLSYVVALPVGILMYTCSTASVPFVHALLTQGLNPGAGMLLLIVGPVTSWSTILVLRKQFGARTLGIYLAVISVLSLAAGLLYTLL